MVAEWYLFISPAKHKDELDSDGMLCVPSGELSKGHFDALKIDHRVVKGAVRGSTAFDIDGYFLEIRKEYNMFFTSRAVLRTSRLLCDRCPHVSLSHVACRVSRRTT